MIGPSDAQTSAETRCTSRQIFFPSEHDTFMQLCQERLRGQDTNNLYIILSYLCAYCAEALQQESWRKSGLTTDDLNQDIKRSPQHAFTMFPDQAVAITPLLETSWQVIAGSRAPSDSMFSRVYHDIQSMLTDIDKQGQANWSQMFHLFVSLTMPVIPWKRVLIDDKSPDMVICYVSAIDRTALAGSAEQLKLPAMWYGEYAHLQPSPEHLLSKVMMIPSLELAADVLDTFEQNLKPPHASSTSPGTSLSHVSTDLLELDEPMATKSLESYLVLHAGSEGKGQSKIEVKGKRMRESKGQRKDGSRSKKQKKSKMDGTQHATLGKPLVVPVVTPPSIYRSSQTDNSELSSLGGSPLTSEDESINHLEVKARRVAKGLTPDKDHDSVSSRQQQSSVLVPKSTRNNLAPRREPSTTAHLNKISEPVAWAQKSEKRRKRSPSPSASSASASSSEAAPTEDLSSTRRSRPESARMNNRDGHIGKAHTRRTLGPKSSPAKAPRGRKSRYR